MVRAMSRASSVHYSEETTVFYSPKTRLPSIQKVIPAIKSAQFGQNGLDEIDRVEFRTHEPTSFLQSTPANSSNTRESLVLQKRAARAKIRRKIESVNKEFLHTSFAEWKISRKQKQLGESCEKLSKVFASSTREPDLLDVWTTWNELHRQRICVERNVALVRKRQRLRYLYTQFVQWQILWVGCSDWRPAARQRILVKHFKKNRMSLEDMTRLLSTEKGKSWARIASQSENDAHFREAIVSCSIDIETLGTVSLEMLEDTTRLLKTDAQRLFNKISKSLQPDFQRVSEILESNPNTQDLIDLYYPFIQQFSELIAQGRHPLGMSLTNSTASENLGDNIGIEHQMDVEDYILLNFCVQAADGGDVRSNTVVADNDQFASTWSRGYQITYADQLYGELKLEFIEVDVILPPAARAYAFVIDDSKHPGQLLHKTLPVCGETFLPKKYKFDLNCNLSSGMAVMLHLVSGPSLPSRYTCWKRSYGANRTVNSILIIRSVQCSSSGDLIESNMHIAMHLTIQDRIGLEILSNGGLHLAKQQGLDMTADQKLDLSLSMSPPIARPGTVDKNKNRVRFESIPASPMDTDSDATASVHSDQPCISPGTEEDILHAWRCWSDSMRSEIPSNCACAYNPKYGEFWICMPQPSTLVYCLESKEGRLKKYFNLPSKLNICSLTFGADGKMYASDGASLFCKILHERFWDVGSRREADRFSKLWVVSAPAANLPTGISVPIVSSETCYALFLKGPIWVLKTTTGAKIKEISLHPPPGSGSSLVVALNSFVIGDGHTVKVYTLSGSILCVLGQCYCEPCLLWTGARLYVADRNSPLWDAYISGSAKGTELSQQKESALRAQKLWTARMRATTPASKVKVGQAMDFAGRPLSRALGDSSSLAYSQGLTYYNEANNQYEYGRFFTRDDKDLRDEMSRLKESFPLLPIDPGNLFRAF